VVRVLPKGDLADRPWLAPGYQEPVARAASPVATQALLRQAHEHLSRSIQQDSQDKLNRLSRTDGEGAPTPDQTPPGAPPFR
jgi:hypothetical protein